MTRQNPIKRHKRRYNRLSETEYAMSRIMGALGNFVSAQMLGVKGVKEYRKKLITLTNNDEFWTKVEEFSKQSKEFAEFARSL